ncbi:MAG: phospho-N-acetylmuramoyl-pentapeptide-transferase [bacterium]
MKENVGLIAGLVEIFVVALLAGVILMPVNIWIMRRGAFGQQVRDDGPEAHLKKSGTPTMGGVGIFAAMVLALIVYGSNAFPRGFVEYHSPKIPMMILFAAFCFLLGLADDILKFRRKGTQGMKARYRLILQILAGLCFCALIQQSLFGYSFSSVLGLREPGLIWTPFGTGGWMLGGWFLLFGVIVFVGTINSVNFTDGLDGLLAGCFLITGAALLIFIFLFGDRGLLPLLVAAMGAVAAFLWFNTHPAKIFMGDSGSLLLGGILATVALSTRSAFFLFVVGFIFVMESLSVILQVASFRLTGRRILKMSPIHHHFELCGWAEQQIVVRFWLLNFLFAVMGILIFCLPSKYF